LNYVYFVMNYPVNLRTYIYIAILCEFNKYIALVPRKNEDCPFHDGK